MVKRVNKLTDAQRAKMDEWADRWIEIGLRLGNADRPKFEGAAKRCYEAAGIPWHGNVVWVSSPLVMAIAAPVASLVIELNKRKAVGGAVGDAVRGAVGDAVGDAVDGAVDGAVRDAVRGAVDGAVRGAVRDAVGDAVGDASIRRAVSQVISNGWHRYIGGQFWAGGWYWSGAYTSFFREICNLELDGDLWERGKAYEDTIESACWWYPHRDFIMVCERPTTIQRELTNPDVQRGWRSHRLHREDGPAVAWADGFGVYSVHGVQIPFNKRYIVDQPHLITVEAIDAEANAEIRRVMIERYRPGAEVSGAGAYLVDGGAKLLDRDETATADPVELYRKEVDGDEPIVMMKLINSTAEPDGHFKNYFIRVPPDQTKALDALAWSYGLTADQYRPMIET